MKTHWIEAQTLLLQPVGETGDFVCQQGLQVASFAPDGQSHFVGMNLRTNLNRAERGCRHADAHL